VNKMDESLYLHDAYLKEWDATVTSVKDDKFITLNKTAFYPKSGGQPHDTGTIQTQDGKEYKVIFCGKFDGNISHELDSPGLKVGDKVHCKIDWDRRYTLMRYHTTAHLISEVIHREAGALITGNQLDTDKSRIDFSLENFDQEKMQKYIDDANAIIQKDLKTSIKFMSRAEAEKLPQLSKLAKGLPPELTTIRIVSIGDFDTQADGGTHVASTKEIGKIVLIKCDNKGKNNRRLYFKLE